MRPSRIHVQPYIGCTKSYTKKQQVENGQEKDDKKTSPETKEAMELNKMNKENSNLSDLWKMFRDDTTMHGLKHSNHNGGYRLRWIIWVVALIAMVSFLIWTLWTQLHDYSKHPTLTKFNVHQVSELPFPAVTICNLSPYRKSQLGLDLELSQYYLAMSRLYPMIPTPDLSSPRFHEPGNASFLNTTSNRIQDMFAVCVFHNVIENCSSVLTPTVTETGVCFTFNHRNSSNGIIRIGSTGSKLSLTFYMRINQAEYMYNGAMAAGIKFLVHDPYEEPDMVNLGSLASPGFTINAAIKMSKYKYLPHPYKAFGDSYCIDTKSTDFRKHLQYHSYYSESVCIRECKRDFIVAKCGCRKFTDPGNETICSMYDMYHCYTINEIKFDSNTSAIPACDCQKPCQFTDYMTYVTTAHFPADVYKPPLSQLGLTDYGEYMELNIFYEDLSYQYIEQIPQFTIENIIGILGGQMGIFLGASLLTVSELLEFVLLSVFITFRRFCNCLRRQGNQKD